MSAPDDAAACGGSTPARVRLDWRRCGSRTGSLHRKQERLQGQQRLQPAWLLGWAAPALLGVSSRSGAPPHLHPSKVHQEHSPPRLAALHHNVLGLDVPARPVKAARGSVLEAAAAEEPPAEEAQRVEQPVRPAAARSALDGCVPSCATAQRQRQPSRLWMTGGRRLPRYCRMASSSEAMRVTSSSSALHPEPTISASDLPLASSCGKGHQLARRLLLAKPAQTAATPHQQAAAVHQRAASGQPGRAAAHLDQEESAVLLGVLFKIVEVPRDAPAQAGRAAMHRLLRWQAVQRMRSAALCQWLPLRSPPLLFPMQDTALLCAPVFKVLQDLRLPLEQLQLLPVLQAAAQQQQQAISVTSVLRRSSRALHAHGGQGASLIATDMHTHLRSDRHLTATSVPLSVLRQR